MAQFTKANSDFQPVFHQDAASYTNGGLNAYTTGEAVNPQGPKLQFGIVTFTGEASAALPGADLLTAVNTIQSRSTIAIYQMDSSGGSASNVLNLALFPTEGWDFTNGGDLDVALTAALGYAVTTSASGVTFDSM
jgi:hypothetical protein|tara:strand:+ start:740 stop:1144 length:405 start_codon:yes stop_codon:yes gene_type:complete